MFNNNNDITVINSAVCRAFQFPEDLYLEPVYWAKTGELDQVEKDEVRSSLAVAECTMMIIR